MKEQRYGSKYCFPIVYDSNISHKHSLTIPFLSYVIIIIIKDTVPIVSVQSVSHVEGSAVQGSGCCHIEPFLFNNQTFEVHHWIILIFSIFLELFLKGKEVVQTGELKSDWRPSEKKRICSLLFSCFLPRLLGPFK